MLLFWQDLLYDPNGGEMFECLLFKIYKILKCNLPQSFTYLYLCIRTYLANSFSLSVSLVSSLLALSLALLLCCSILQNCQENVQVSTSNNSKVTHCSETKGCGKSLTKPCVYCAPKYNGGQDCVSASFPLLRLSLAKRSPKSNYIHQGDVCMI